MKGKNKPDLRERGLTTPK
jgi:hypothetical protein